MRPVKFLHSVPGFCGRLARNSLRSSSSRFGDWERRSMSEGYRVFVIEV